MTTWAERTSVVRPVIMQEQPRNPEEGEQKRCTQPRQTLNLGVDVASIREGVLGPRGFVPLEDPRLRAVETASRPNGSDDDVIEMPRRIRDVVTVNDGRQSIRFGPRISCSGAILGRERTDQAIRDALMPRNHSMRSVDMDALSLSEGVFEHLLE